jgi:hypothetical protein
MHDAPLLADFKGQPTMKVAQYPAAGLSQWNSDCKRQQREW